MRFEVSDPCPGVNTAEPWRRNERQAYELIVEMESGLATLGVITHGACGVSALGLRIFAQVLLAAADAQERLAGGGP